MNRFLYVYLNNVTFCEFQINQYAAVGLNRDTFTMLSLQCKMQISIFPDKNDSVVIIVSAWLKIHNMRVYSLGRLNSLEASDHTIVQR